jgi:hypothetical protein
MSAQKQIGVSHRRPGKSGNAERQNKTSLNARRDPISGQVIILSEKDRPAFEQLKEELIADFAPKTSMELHLANSIAWDIWRLDHLRATAMTLSAMGTQDSRNAIETNRPETHTALTEAITFERQSHTLATISRCEYRLNQSVHRNLAVLKALKAEDRRGTVLNREGEPREKASREKVQYANAGAGAPAAEVHDIATWRKPDGAA